MSKPEEIAAIEKAYGVTLEQKDEVVWGERNCYALNSDGAVVALNLISNQIQEIKGLENLTALNILFLDNNQIQKIKGLENLTALNTLSLHNNQIQEIKGLENLTALNTLDLRDNQIQEIKGLEKLLEKLEKLEELYIFDNPFEQELPELKLKFGDSNLTVIKNYFALTMAEDKIEIAAIQKVMLVGNHACGKSTFLEYFLTDEIKEQNTTHVLKVQEYPQNSEKKAMFYDFGGQDYYHGIYKAFMTNKSLNLIFWKNDANSNTKGDDKNGGETQNFNREYWIKQIRHYGNDNKSWLIQTHVDKRGDRAALSDAKLQAHISDEYHISLTNPPKPHLKALKENLENVIDECNETKRFLSKKYIDFLQKEIYGYQSHEPVKAEELKRKLGKIAGFDFQEQLKQLTLQGEILYCEVIDDTVCPNPKAMVWPNPKATVEHIHKNVFEKEAMKKYAGKAPKAEFEELCDSKTIKMLEINKVVYLDKTDANNQFYVIPSYLPNAEENGSDFFMFANFAVPSLVLKFEYFIPFGFINQLICHYGDLKEAKIYWRDVLMFTADETKTRALIKLDFEKLLIKIFVSSQETSRAKEVVKIIFDDLITFYNDKAPNYKSRLFSEEEKEKQAEREETKECPDDVHICLDNRYFVHYNTLQDEKTTTEIVAYELKKESVALDKENPKILSTRAFAFMAPQNKELKNMKKIFVSYSRDDALYRDELRKHLNLLKIFDIADNWACEDMDIGRWNKQIQKELLESDIVVYMLSANFFSSPYIREKEVLEVFRRMRTKPDKKIIPVIVSEFAGFDTLKKSISRPTDVQKAMLDIGNHQFLPYGYEENKLQVATKERIMSLEEHSKNRTLNNALTQIVNKIAGL